MKAIMFFVWTAIAVFWYWAIKDWYWRYREEKAARTALVREVARQMRYEQALRESGRLNDFERWLDEGH